jgi:hypothetical protein
VEPKARRHALRHYLTDARAALDRGDRVSALRFLDEALEVDPQFLAAQALKDRIEGSAGAPAFELDDIRRRASSTETAQPLPWRPPEARSPAADQPIVSAEGWARFEHRARLRRLERRSEAARNAIARAHFDEAKAILEEIREIDPAHPDLISLSMELDAGRHFARTRRIHAGPVVAAAAVFAAFLLGARYLEGPGRTALPSWTSLAPPAPAVAPAPVDSATIDTAAAASIADATPPAAPSADTAAAVPDTSGPAVTFSLPSMTLTTPAPSLPSPAAAPPAITAPAVVAPPPSRLDATADARPAAVATAGNFGAAVDRAPEPDPTAVSAAVTTATLPGTLITEPAPPPALTVTAPRPQPPAVSGDAAVIRADVASPPDEELVRRTLQQYRAAYETLDARSAQAVWPGVDSDALQRAFDGLQSQRLTFDDCQVQVRGAAGTAVCRGTARYVPKVGSRDPRVEPRVWSFSLRKAGDQWRIDSARTER